MADIRELTDSGLVETAGLISRREYNLSIVRSRQLAEQVIKSYASEKGIEYTTLADTIENLYENGIINRTSRDAFHSVRLYGNKAVHEGDSDPEDAQRAYYLVKNEVQTYNSRKIVNVDRTPVRVEPQRSRRSGASAASSGSESEPDGSGDSGASASGGAYSVAAGSHSVGYESADSADGTESAGGSGYTGAQSRLANGTSGGGSGFQGSLGGRQSGNRNGNARSQSGRRTSGSASGRSGSRRTGSSSGHQASGGRTRQNGTGARRSSGSAQTIGGFTIYDILKFLIPIVVVILLLIIIRSCVAGGSSTEKTTVQSQSQTESTAETVAEPETTQPETEPETEPQVVEYKIKGDGVNIRYADNQNRIYTQLSNGTAIGTVTEIEGSDYVQFTLDGVNVVVRNDLIEPIS